MSQNKSIHNWGTHSFLLHQIIALRNLLEVEEFDYLSDIVLNPHLPFYVPIAAYSDAD